MDVTADESGKEDIVRPFLVIRIRGDELVASPDRFDSGPLDDDASVVDDVVGVRDYRCG